MGDEIVPKRNEKLSYKKRPVGGRRARVRRSFETKTIQDRKKVTCDYSIAVHDILRYNIVGNRFESPHPCRATVCVYTLQLGRVDDVAKDCVYIRTWKTCAHDRDILFFLIFRVLACSFPEVDVRGLFLWRRTKNPDRRHVEKTYTNPWKHPFVRRLQPHETSCIRVHVFVIPTPTPCDSTLHKNPTVLSGERNLPRAGPSKDGRLYTVVVVERRRATCCTIQSRFFTTRLFSTMRFITRISTETCGVELE